MRHQMVDNMDSLPAKAAGSVCHLLVCGIRMRHQMVDNMDSLLAKAAGCVVFSSTRIFT
jgi:hypothetical protein